MKLYFSFIVLVLISSCCSLKSLYAADNMIQLGPRHGHDLLGFEHGKWKSSHVPHLFEVAFRAEPEKLTPPNKRLYFSWKLCLLYSLPHQERRDIALGFHYSIHNIESMYIPIYNEVIKYMDATEHESEDYGSYYLARCIFAEGLQAGFARSKAGRGFLIPVGTTIVTERGMSSKEILTQGGRFVEIHTCEQDENHIIFVTIKTTFKTAEAKTLFPELKIKADSPTLQLQTGDKFPLPRLLVRSGKFEFAEEPESERIWLRITHIEPEDKKNKFPAWIALEPVLPEPYSVLPAFDPPRKD